MKKIEGKLNALLENEAIFYGAFSQSVRLHLPKDFFFFAYENCIDYSIKSMKISKYLFIKNKNVSIKWCNLK